MARPLLPFPSQAPARPLWRRFGDDRELVALKIALLLGMGALTAMLELVP